MDRELGGEAFPGDAVDLIRRRCEAEEVEVRVAADFRVGDESCASLGSDRNIAERLQLDLSELRADVEADSASADSGERGSGSIVVPGDRAVGASLADGASDGGGNVEGGKSLGGQSGEDSDSGERGEHG